MTVDGVTDRLREQKDSPCASSGGGGKSLSLQHERVVIQDRGFGCRRSPPWGGCDRVGPPQAAPCRPASARTGDDELRWNADHHAGHALPATPRARSGAGADRRAATQERGAPPAHHPRQRRSLCPLGAAHAVGRAVPAVGVGLHAAGDRQPQRADQGPQFIVPTQRRSRAQSQQSRRLHPLQSQQVMAAAVSAGPVRPRLLMAPARHSGTTGSGLPPGRLPALGRVLMKSRLVTAPWINVRFGPLCDSSRTSPEVREAPLTDL